jgi:UBX domain-containing protein 7
MYRAPFELIYRMPWDIAREDGKKELKWLMVNVQSESVWDCQVLNRDIWKHEGIKQIIKENFLFLQYQKDDPAGQQYMQYYFQNPENQDEYPHIAIVDPRTGEKVKVWSGTPAPKPQDFMMELVSFLDRYSLDPHAKNPVAKRKPEKKKAVDFDRMTEEEQLDYVMKQSMGGADNAEGSSDDDPDALTKSIGDLKGKGKNTDAEEDLMDFEETPGEATKVATEIRTPSPFSLIASNNPHHEPAANPTTVTRVQFRHPGGRPIVRRFELQDRVRRIYEWLKADPIEGTGGKEFELVFTGRNLINHLDETIEVAGLKNASIMVEFVEE